jgi:hypothetical protein
VLSRGKGTADGVQSMDYMDTKMKKYLETTWADFSVKGWILTALFTYF